MSEDAIRGVVVAHGAMAQGLVDAVRRIAGSAADGLVALSNEGMGPDELQAALRDVGGPGPVVIFADMYSGSCGMAAFASCRDCPRPQVVICGVNLPLLLDFVFHRELPLDALVDRLVQKGREGVRPLPSPRG
jgi:mannose/fructose-specific phosphotransferase system component IIA